MDFISDSNKSGHRLKKFVTSKYEFIIVFLFSFLFFLLFLSPSSVGYLIHYLLSFFTILFQLLLLEHLCVLRTLTH